MIRVFWNIKNIQNQNNLESFKDCAKKHAKLFLICEKMKEWWKTLLIIHRAVHCAKNKEILISFPTKKPHFTPI